MQQKYILIHSIVSKDAVKFIKYFSDLAIVLLLSNLLGQQIAKI